MRTLNTSNQGFNAWKKEDAKVLAKSQLDDEEHFNEITTDTISNEKPSSNMVQTSVKPGSIPSSNMVQTSVKPGSESSSENKIESETWFKPSSKSGAFIVQTSVKPSSNVVQKLDFHRLSPLQQKLLIFLFEEGQMSRSKISQPFNGPILANRLESSLEGLRTAVKRLVKSGFLTIAAVKSGRIGWTQYELPETVYQQMAVNDTWFKPSSNIVQTSVKPSSKPSSQCSSKSPYSSSNDFLKVTTITGVPENLARFGISAVNLQNLISSGKASQEMVERSLAALSYDVENGKTGNIANILFGVLGKGREYISQKYSEGLQTELDQELARITAAEENQKRVAELKLKAKFQKHLQSNPELIESVREKNKGYISNQELLEKMAFEEFKDMEEVSV